jgi:hypothetical protein
VIAEDIIMKMVVVSTWSCMKAFLNRLHQSRFVEGRPAGSRIRTLLINIDDCTDAVYLGEAITSVINHGPALEQFFVKNALTSGNHLLCLANVSARTLNNLDITVSPLADGLFLIINSLKLLRVLWIQFEPEPWQHSPAHPVKLDAVADVLWKVTETDDQALAFFARCQFGPHCSMEFHLPGLRTEKAYLLKPLFASNSFRECIPVIPEPCISVLAPEILRSPQVHFFVHLPQPSVLCLGIVPNIMILSYSAETLTRMWPLLDTLATLNTAPTTVKIADVSGGDDARFCWMGGTMPERAPVVGRMLAAAVTLHKRHVRVLDECGHDVYSAHECVPRTDV